MTRILASLKLPAFARSNLASDPASAPTLVPSSAPGTAGAGVRTQAATTQDIGAAIRFLLVLSLIGSIGALKLAITSQTQQLSVQLDHARSEVERSEIRRERLLVERAMLRQPEHLQAVAAQLDLAAPVAVIDVPPERAP